MTIGELIRKKRIEKDMTLEDVGRAVGVTRATVSRWESGEIGKLGRDKIDDLSRVLGIDPLVFILPREAITPDELSLLNAYRSADPGIRSSVRKLLDLPEEKNDICESAM